ncbi:Clathrin adaptor complexes medium subunit family protein [Perilla frutescens var. hirtella]|nr:Clathrin adaptor complexes medium subunit family protein [Perilla frutescens var. hirtella]
MKFGRRAADFRGERWQWRFSAASASSTIHTVNRVNFDLERGIVGQNADVKESQKKLEWSIKKIEEICLCDDYDGRLNGHSSEENLWPSDSIPSLKNSAIVHTKERLQAGAQAAVIEIDGEGLAPNIFLS